jgi:hypothetical protein
MFGKCPTRIVSSAIATGMVEISVQIPRKKNESVFEKILIVV